MRVALASETDFDGFRQHARRLLAAQVDPGAVHWMTPGGDGDLFPADAEPTATEGAAPALAVPSSFLDTCRFAVLHRDPQRFALLYRLLWRLAHEPGLRHDPLDDEMMLARRLAKQVGHAVHKMRAFVRFRQVDDGSDEPLHVAWFEPAHRVVEVNAPWFARRFANMRWAILSPDACVHWDGRQLRHEPGADRSQAPAADAGESLWLTYYRSIFNPARLKLDMMRKEMPVRYWANLPEARLIGALASQATDRSGRMIATEPQAPRRRIVPIARTREPAAPGSIDELRANTDACRDCPGAAAATQAVHGAGPLRPALMFVGEQPGDQEDVQGRPFVGPAGQLLREAMRAAGIDETGVFLTNAVRHFHYELRGKRRIHKTPGQREVAACSHWLEQEIALVRPGGVVALGGTAARALLGRPVAVTKERGEWITRPDGLRVFVTLHPSALLRMDDAARPAALARFEADLSACARVS